MRKIRYGFSITAITSFFAALALLAVTALVFAWWKTAPLFSGVFLSYADSGNGDVASDRKVTSVITNLYYHMQNLFAGWTE